MIKSDKWIKKMALEKEMINPFSDRQVRYGVISYGLSSYGYDIKLADEFEIFDRNLVKSPYIDPKNFDKSSLVKTKGDHCIIHPNSFVLGRTVEYFKIPRNILTICYGKSTYARSGIVVNVTPFEPEWEGYATLSICNTASVPVKIYANEGIAQIIFLEGNEEPLISYADKKGKYQAQKGITSSKIDK